MTFDVHALRRNASLLYEERKIHTALREAIKLSTFSPIHEIRHTAGATVKRLSMILATVARIRATVAGEI